MPTSIEAQGVTVEEAIQVALNQLGVTRDRVEIEIIHHPRSGFLGIGARRAKVRATVREAFLADGEEYDMSTGTSVGRGRRTRRTRRRRGRRGEGRQESEQAGRRSDQGEGRGRGEGHRDDSRSERQKDTRQPKERRGRDSARGSDEASRREDRRPQDRRQQDRRPQDRRPQPEARENRPQSAARPPEARAAIEPRAPRDMEPRPSRPLAEDVVATPGPAPRLEEAESQGARTNLLPAEEVRRRGETVVRELLKRMGFQALVSSFVDAEEGEVVIKVDADAEGLLIGRRGQTLDAVEHLVNRMVLSGDSAAEARVAVDVGGYRQRRRDTLLELADRLRVRALTQGRRIQVSPMSPRDRRILQGALSRDDSVRSRVLGTGFYRRVLVFPVGLEEGAITLEQEDEAAEAQIGVEEDEGV